MFCSDSCDFGCKVPSGAKVNTCGNGQQSAAGVPQSSQQQQQQQFNMCFAPLPMQANNEMCARCEQAEPPRVGLCMVTEGPEGLSIDCNVPLPNSFNLDEYKKQMFYSCCPPTNMSTYYDSYSLPQSGVSGTFVGMSPGQGLSPISSPNPIISPGCSFHCQSCPLGGSCPGYESLPMQSHPMQPTPGALPLPKSAGISRQEPAMSPTPAMLPQIFCMGAPNNNNGNTASCMEASNGLQQSDQQPMYFCGMVPAQAWNLQAINLVPVMPIPQQQQPLSTNSGQDSQQLSPQQQQASQFLRLPCDLSFSRLLTELRRERDRSCCDSSATTSSTQPLSLQLFAPTHTVTFCDPPATTMCAAGPAKREASTSVTPPPDPPATRSTPPTTSPAATSSTVPPDSSTATAAAAPSRARSVSPKRSRSCLRNKDLWGGSGPAQSHPAYPSSAQHGSGNVCMKCGNCWHCPRCNCPSCSSCSWHPGLLRPPSRESRCRQFSDR
ncbi:hypothetical protein KR067_004011 [Drosophila pandora]|nr:hypothetical protein KR067_004011 [Drosophila pandora]